MCVSCQISGGRILYLTTFRAPRSAHGWDTVLYIPSSSVPVYRYCYLLTWRISVDLKFKCAVLSLVLRERCTVKTMFKRIMYIRGGGGDVRESFGPLSITGVLNALVNSSARLCADAQFLGWK